MTIMAKIQSATLHARKRTGIPLLGVRVKQGMAQICDHEERGRYWEPIPISEWFPVVDTVARLDAMERA